ncbi:hypothetical protein APHAL10511_003588 [Amanita phalloides]|nr:hypothetical protein APHAL10511_003588 [Amanita phalloides]
MSGARFARSELDCLLSLVQHKRFGAAHRVLHNIIDARKLHKIVPHTAYESAALSALRWDDSSRALREFSIWFKLVPPIDHPNAPVNGPFFKKTIQCLLQSGRPSANVPLIKQFALICASKGYVNLVYNWVLDPLSRIMNPAPEFATFLKEIEAAAVGHARTVSNTHHTLASQLRVAAVQLLCDMQCHRLAQDVLTSNAADERVVLPNETYEYVIQQFLKARQSKQGRVRGIQTLRRLQEAENTKRLSPRHRLRLQVPLHVLLRQKNTLLPQPTQPSPPADTTNYSPPSAPSAFLPTDGLQSKLGKHTRYTYPLLNLSGRLSICHSTLHDIESKLVRLRPLRPSDLRALLYGIHLLLLRWSPHPSSKDGPAASTTTRYVGLVNRYHRLRERALSSALRRPAMTWLVAEIMVYDWLHDHRQIFRLVQRYYSLEDVPKVVGERLACCLVSSLSEVDKGADAGVEMVVPQEEEEEEEEEEGDKLVLEPTSRAAIVLVKWLVIQTSSRCIHPAKAKEGLVRLWGELRESVLERVIKGSSSAPDERGAPDQAVIRDLVAALVWSFSKVGEYPTLVRPKSALFLTLCRVAWLRDVWLSLEEELGRSPSWREFSAFVQREREQEVMAEGYLETMGKNVGSRREDVKGNVKSVKDLS